MSAREVTVGGALFIVAAAGFVLYDVSKEEKLKNPTVHKVSSAERYLMGKEMAQMTKESHATQKQLDRAVGRKHGFSPEEHGFLMRQWLWIRGK
eukprot:CAMPEP_0174312852 /NCGR_PEP_ID=MMETSP0810-20121108/4570_1 /TAXON_ID=73025 ORGANISM="Eutreptiella gymnastica-like, Strain CCMP1594" /NCGR_SAMPLE_ID=MMETSP0810 /ASSEMBLY_ACC=CAM_ASM_000659 /LENGTH=93 /DNA_ID=CAMNT_0015421391 /DNA_START=22 /DNA_END=303 /DNA_ORIENTATION=+